MEMATHGNIGEFNRAREDWISYWERMQQYFTIATDAKQRAILLCTCRAETYQLIRSLMAPQKLMDKSLRDIIQLVRDHHTPPPYYRATFSLSFAHSERRGNKLQISSPTYKNSLSIVISPTHSTTCFVIDSFAASGMCAYNDASWQSRCQRDDQTPLNDSPVIDP